MKISYDLGNQLYTYAQNNIEEINKLNFVLTNNNGCFLNLGAIKNSCKFQGLNIYNEKTKDIYKFVEEIIPTKLKLNEISHKGNKIERTFKPITVYPTNVIVNEENKVDHLFGEEGVLEYDEEGNVVEEVKTDSQITPKDRFYLGPSGGLIYEIENFKGELLIDIDMKKRDDFDTEGRNYNVYTEDGIIFIEYTKTNTQGEYKQYLGIKSTNFSYNLCEEWTKKNYEYSKERGSLNEWYVYRLLKVNIDNKQKIIFGTGFTKQEVINEIDLLQIHQSELENYDKQKYLENVNIEHESFKKPLTQDTQVAYKLSQNALLSLTNTNLNSQNLKKGIYAGLPWFSDVWARDEIISLRALINLKEYEFVKERILDYLNQIGPETGELNILQNKTSNGSFDATFWLVKRIGDLIYALTEKRELHEIFIEKELTEIYEKLSLAFNKIITNNWDFDNELIKTKYAQSWMDTIDVKYPLDMQVLLLEFTSVMGFLSQITSKKDTEKYLDLENGLRDKIRTTYLKENTLYNDIDCTEETHNCNVFLAYYIYPDLFQSAEWEKILDNSLKVMKTSWGGISSISKKATSYQPNYTGENNLSYHRGDSWYFINNITAIVLHDLNEKKYRSTISQILISSTNDLLKLGTIGYSSEVSSSSKQKAQGSMAQTWSSATYIEMIDKLFQKK